MDNKNRKDFSILESEYKDWIVDLKKRFKRSQIKAAVKVNNELIYFYWTLGRDIVKMKAESKWGSAFYENLSSDLKNALPDTYGFSTRNLRIMRQFYELFPENEIVQQVAAEIISIPWGHIILLISKVNGNTSKALFYIRKTIENNWSRAVLANFLETNLYERNQNVITNFNETMPKEDSDLAKQLIKDPYSFNFLTLEEKYNEKELKEALIDNIQKFLTELGTGFAYMGKEYRLEVNGSELFVDMLFYNTRLHRYIVIEVKINSFKPDYIGQIGTYVVAVNHILKTDRDDRTIGILICKDKNEVLVRYALESSSEPLGVSSFKLSELIPENFKGSLPTIEEIEKELKK